METCPLSPLLGSVELLPFSGWLPRLLGSICWAESFKLSLDRLCSFSSAWVDIPESVSLALLEVPSTADPALDGAHGSNGLLLVTGESTLFAAEALVKVTEALIGLMDKVLLLFCLEKIGEEPP